MNQPLLDWAEEVTIQALTEQIHQEKNPELLFRQDTLSTKMWSGLARLVGKKYLEAYAPLLKKIIRETPPKCEALLKEKDKFLELVESFIKVTIASFGKIPKPMKNILKTISLSLFAKFPQYPLGGLSSLFFLRFLCPAVSTATNYGIVNIEIPPCAKKLLVSVSKVLQNLANGIVFDSLDPLSFTNSFIQENYKIMIVLLRKIAEKDMFDMSEFKCSTSGEMPPVPSKQASCKFDFNLNLEKLHRSNRAHSIDLGDVSSNPSSVKSCAETPTPSSVHSFECLSASSFSSEPTQTDDSGTATPLPSTESVVLDTVSESPVATWSSLDVSIWLRKINLAAHVRTFLLEQISGPKLLELDDASLYHMGIMKASTRAFMLKQIKYLKRNAGMFTSCDSLSLYAEEDSDTEGASETDSEAESSSAEKKEVNLHEEEEEEAPPLLTERKEKHEKHDTFKKLSGVLTERKKSHTTIAYLTHFPSSTKPSPPQHPHIQEIQRRERSKSLSKSQVGLPPFKEKK